MGGLDAGGDAIGGVTTGAAERGACVSSLVAGSLAGAGATVSCTDTGGSRVVAVGVRTTGSKVTTVGLGGATVMGGADFSITPSERGVSFCTKSWVKPF